MEIKKISALKTYSKKIYNGRTREEWERIKTDCKANSWIYCYMNCELLIQIDFNKNDFNKNDLNKNI